MNIYIPNLRLPSEYQEVEYIQSTGTQVIDCNIVIGATKLKTDLKINSQYIGESAIFLSRRALNGNFLMFYNNAFRWHSASAVDISCALNTDYSIQTENGKITINGTSYTCTASSSDSGSDLSMCIFGKSGAQTYGRFKLYYMKMWNNTTLVRDLVPCYRKSDSVIGLYDLVNDQFYTNSGTGTFTKGNDVNMSEVKNIYIGEYGWKPGSNTIAYYPLKTNGTEGSGKSGLDITTTGITFSDGVAVLDGNQRATIPSVTGYKTICFWYNENSSNTGMVLGNTTDKYIQLYNGVVYFKGTSSFNFTVNASKDARHLLTVTQTTASNSGASSTGNNMTLYIDSTLKGTQNNAYLDWALYGMGWSGNSSYPYAFKGKVSELIVESSEWTSDEIADYYNLTKSNYGL